MKIENQIKLTFIIKKQQQKAVNKYVETERYNQIFSLIYITYLLRLLYLMFIIYQTIEILISFSIYFN